MDGPRIRLFLATCFCTAAVAGCGGDDADSGSALDNSLAYLPEDAPLVVTIGTDPDGEQFKSVQKIVERFPFGDQLTKSLEDQVMEGDVNFEKDVKPLLGNEFVVGAPSVEAFGDDSDSFVGAIEATDADKLEELVKRGDAKPAGERNGATLYKDSDGDFFAIEDGVLIVAGTRELLDTALEQREADGNLTAEAFAEDTEGMPEGALVRAAIDLEQVLAADPETKDARKIEWVAALRTMAMAISFEDDRARLDFRLATDSEQLAEEDLPFAAGPESPAVIDSEKEIGFGLRGPEQILAFAESAGQSIDPAAFGDYKAGRKAIESRLEVSLEDDILGQLEDDVAVSVGLLEGTFGVQAPVKDPEAFKKTLDKLGPDLADIAEGAAGETVGYARPKPGEDFHALATADGDSVVYGVVDGLFVLTNDSERAGRLAEEKTKEVEGAEGAIAMSADAEQLVALAVRNFGGPGLGAALGGSVFAEPLGVLSGSLAAETDGLTGKVELTFD